VAALAERTLVVGRDRHVVVTADGSLAVLA
jgi:hypothetical protein